MFSKGTARWRRVCRSRCAIGRTRFAVRWRVGHGAHCRGLNSPVAPGSRRGHTPEPPHDFGNWSRLYDRWPIFSAVSTLRHWRKMGFDRSLQPPAICSIRIPPRIFPIRSLLRLDCWFMLLEKHGPTPSDRINFNTNLSVGWNIFQHFDAFIC